jgi:hypothetical protein
MADAGGLGDGDGAPEGRAAGAGGREGAAAGAGVAAATGTAVGAAAGTAVGAAAEMGASCIAKTAPQPHLILSRGLLALSSGIRMDRRQATHWIVMPPP